jgi:hypothetical protein
MEGMQDMDEDVRGELEMENNDGGMMRSGRGFMGVGRVIVRMSRRGRRRLVIWTLNMILMRTDTG